MAAKGTIFAAFAEHRWFPFRKDPVILQGEMRLSPDRGLSLHYLAPEDRTMMVDAHGLLLRDAKGRSREAPADAAEAGAALLPIMRFDLAALSANFDVHAARQGDTWRFDFVPHPDSPVERMGSIVVKGDGETVRNLEFRSSPVQRVEIIVGDTRTGLSFTPEEQKKFFR
jgi:hypothetical protein